MIIKDYIRDIQDFPKKGVLFKDISPLLSNPNATKECLKILVDSLQNQKIDKVIGVESRGFLFGMLLAQELKAGFVLVRKPNKLPFDTLSATYDLEYGTDTLQIHADAITKGEKILIHDDVLATGGTAKAVCDLVEQLGGQIVQLNFLMEIGFLKAREQLSNHNVFAATKD